MNKKIAIISAAFVLSLPITPVFAQVADLAVKPEGEVRGQVKMQERKQLAQEGADAPEVKVKKEMAAQKRLEFQDKKEKMVADKCQNIEKKIANRVNRYENNGQMLTKVYGNMKTRLARLSAQLKTSGADTTKLDADLVILSGKIDKLLADQASFMATLKTSQTAVCGSSEGEFKTQLENARKVPELIKQDRTEIKTFFQTTIKEDLQAIMVKLGGTLEATEQETEEADGVKKLKKNGANATSPTAPVTTTAPAAPETQTSTTATNTTATVQ
ncbi:MAG: hypothetical protein ACD_5C00347G0006 [uncultured bacterium]|nr:MAG: hypothetical protein ACD_5C00347G0006 [uncultured bacterium]